MRPLRCSGKSLLYPVFGVFLMALGVCCGGDGG